MASNKGVVSLDVMEFEEQFPELQITSYTPAQLARFWAICVSVVGDSDANSFAPYDPENGEIERKLLLYTVLAHLLYMSKQNAQGGGLSGRVSSVSEGSVSVSLEPYAATSLNAQYWTSSPYGRDYLVMQSKYRRGGRLYSRPNFHPWT